MCLSVIAKIEKFTENSEAIVELGNVRKKVNLGLINEKLSVGDWVLIHTGFAIAKVNEDKAMEILSIYNETS